MTQTPDPFEQDDIHKKRFLLACSAYYDIPYDLLLERDREKPFPEPDAVLAWVGLFVINRGTPFVSSLPEIEEGDTLPNSAPVAPLSDTVRRQIKEILGE